MKSSFFPRFNWWNNIVGIKSIDQSRRTLTLTDDCSFAIRPADRYYVQGLFEELDTAGEWYLDPSTKKLYFWPPPNIDVTSANVHVPTLATILRMVGTSHVTFRGFTFFGCANSAIALRECTDCLIAGNTLHGIGDHLASGVSIFLGKNNGVVGNDIFDVGRNAISIHGGNQVTLESAGHYADNNYLHHVGVDYKQGVGVWISGCGIRASHNLIHDGPRFGIGFFGNNHTIEYNHIRHVSIETEDTGGVYTGSSGDWLGSRGCVLRCNHIHDVLGYGQEKGRWLSPHFSWGIYLDNNASGMDIVGNIIRRCGRGAIHLHNGMANRIWNNLFLECKEQQIQCTGWVHNKGYWKEQIAAMSKRYESVADQPAWKSMRNMKTHPTDAVLPDGTTMSGNRFLRNIIVYEGDISQYTQFRNFSFRHNQCDKNLIWAGGHPINTGELHFGKDRSGNLAPNGGFEEGVAGEMPSHWYMQVPPFPGMTAVLANDADSGSHALRIDAAFNKKTGKYPIVVTKEQELSPRHGYRLKARMKATHDGAMAKLGLQSYLANEYYWSSWPINVQVGTEWQDVEFTITIPNRGAPKYHEKMKGFRIRIDFPDKEGALLVDDVRLTECEILDSWASWQASGMDRHSVVADPLFVDRDHNDFRLQSNSPALKMGFKPIPIEKIGPYQDGLRATWPIVEAEGVRENPLVVER